VVSRIGEKEDRKLTVIMAPELEPVTKTFLGSALYFLRAYETMLAMALLSPPPLCFRDFCEETSQQVPLWLCCQHIYTQFQSCITHVGRRRVDDNETLLVSQLGVGRSLVVSLGSTSAVVNGNNDWRLGSKLGRHINVHASARGVVTKVLDLSELGRTTSERVARNGTQKGKDGSNERREMHLV
jgi:hypothetical protein